MQSDTDIAFTYIEGLYYFPSTLSTIRIYPVKRTNPTKITNLIKTFIAFYVFPNLHTQKFTLVSCLPLDVIIHLEVPSGHSILKSATFPKRL